MATQAVAGMKLTHAVESTIGFGQILCLVHALRIVMNDLANYHCMQVGLYVVVLRIAIGF